MTAALGVSDIDRSLAWYRDVLGFEVIYKLDDWGWAELRSPIAGVNVGIGQSEEVEPRGGATLTFGVDDIDAARGHLEALDVRFDGETSEVPRHGAARDVLRPGRELVHARRAGRRRRGVLADHPVAKVRDGR